MNDDNRAADQEALFQRMLRNIPVAFRQDELFRYALIMGILALMISFRWL